ncbi:MAG: hypothetical protein WCJ19_02680 [bacterium]
MKPKILIKHKFYPRDIIISASDISTRKTNIELENSIEQTWNQIFEKAKLEGKKIWNSKIYRVNNYKFDDEKLFLELGPSDFKNGLVFKMIPFFETLSLDCYPLNMFCLANVKTLDEKYVFGFSDKTIQYSNILGIGGVFSKDELLVNNSEDLFENMYKELKEEINVTKSMISEIVISGLLISEGANIGLIFNVDLNVTSLELQKNFEIENDGELERLIFVEQEKYKDYMQNLAPGHKSLLWEFL